jgi:hypothetical protein
MPRLFNHRGEIRGYTAIQRAHVLPGSLIEFKYAVESAHDKKPIVLVLANGLTDRLVNSKNNILMHGINLNYLTKYEMGRLFYVMAAVPIRGEDLDMVEQIRDSKGKYIAASQRYTRLSLPTTIRNKNTSQIRPMITEIYGNVADAILTKKDAYRKYIMNEVSGVRGLKFKIPKYAR